MSELDDKQKEILEAWKRGECVQGYTKGEFSIQHAMMNAVTGPYANDISQRSFDNNPASAGMFLLIGIKLVARELAATHLGHPYLDDAEKAMKENNPNV